MDNSELRAMLAKAYEWPPENRDVAVNVCAMEFPRLLADSEAYAKLRAEIAGAPVGDLCYSEHYTVSFDGDGVSGDDAAVAMLGQRVALLRLPAGEA